MIKVIGFDNLKHCAHFFAELFLFKRPIIAGIHLDKTIDIQEIQGAGRFPFDMIAVEFHGYKTIRIRNRTISQSAWYRL